MNPGGAGVDTRRTALVQDGQVIRIQDNAIHWSYARRWLDRLAPNPADAEWVRQWYLGTTAWQADRHRWSDSLENAEYAARVFPKDARFVFDAGVVHEVFGLPRIQAAREQAPVNIKINDPRTEFGAAERLLQAAVSLDPSFTEARLHYGEVLARLGRYRDAERELTAARAAVDEPALAYYASLFLGYAQGALDERDLATTSFEGAATLFPLAQSPLLGLSQLARQADDRAAATRALGRLFALPPQRDPRDDPWLEYADHHSRQADTLVAAIRKPFLP
jgi:hypothetical protein